MSAGTPPKAGKALIDRLPPDRRNELIMIGRDALGRFGYAFQEGSRRPPCPVRLPRRPGRQGGHDRPDVVRGRHHPGGRHPLPAGTASSALSRARERAASRLDARLHAPAVSGMHMQVPARAGNALQDPADQRSEAGFPAALPGPSASPPPAASPYVPEFGLRRIRRQPRRCRRPLAAQRPSPPEKPRTG